MCWTTLYGKKTQIMYIRHDPTNNGGTDEQNIKETRMSNTVVYVSIAVVSRESDRACTEVPSEFVCAFTLITWVCHATINI
jgi:hypothetical protein